MTTIKEKQMVLKYHQENGTKKTIIDTELWQVTNSDGVEVQTDYYKVLTLDFYLFLLDQIPE